MVHSIAKELIRRWRLKIRLFGSAAEKYLKLRSGRPKLGGGCEREIELQTAGHEEYSINGRPAGQIEQVDRLQFIDELSGPIFEHIKDRDLVRDREGQIKVR